MIIQEGYKIISEEEIRCFFIETEKDFLPPLSQRVNIREYAKKIYNNAHIILAEENDNKKIIGLAAFYENDNVNKIAFLSSINVKKEYSNKGIAKSLISKMIKIVKNNQFNSIQLDVFSKNVIAINLYEKYGFNTVSEKNKYLKMQYNLSKEEKN